MPKDKNQLMKKNTMENTNEMKDTNRRQFLKTTLYASIALGLSACGKSADADAPAHTSHAGMNHSTPPAGVPFDMTRLISGAPFAAPALLVFDALEHHVRAAALNIAPSKQTVTRDGASSQLWTYQTADNNAHGGAMIDAFEGETLRITAHNHLPEATTVHWHGIAVPPEQDGHPHDAIAPNAAKTYEFTLDADSAGTYWYHPPPHGKTATQTAMGLAAPLIVRSRTDPLAALGIPDHVLLLTALQLDGNAQIAAHTMDEQMNGRDGNVVFVNGQHQPVMQVAPNSTHRFRLINASNARYMRLSFGGLKMTVVGTDGGLLAQPLPAQSELLLAPAERIEVLMTFDKKLPQVKLQALPYDKGWMDGGMGGQKPILTTTDLMQFELAGEAVTSVIIPQKLRDIKPMGQASITRRIVLTEHMQMSMANGVHSMKMDFMLNGQSFDMNRIDFSAKQHAVELWEIVNQTDMDHPFHIHGNHFQVVSIEQNGKITPIQYLAWKDTVNTRAGQTVRLKIAHKHTGVRMYHCHILEHEDSGMMGQYEVLA